MLTPGLRFWLADGRTSYFLYDYPRSLDFDNLDARACRDEAAISHHVDELLAEACHTRGAQVRRRCANRAEQRDGLVDTGQRCLLLAGLGVFTRRRQHEAVSDR